MDWKESYQHWNEQEHLDSELREELDQLKGNEEGLIDAFYQQIPFGTAGMRGKIGVGPNRLNLYTVRYVTEGLARLMEDSGRVDDGVAIAYDGRRHSLDFANEAAQILAKHGIKTYVFTGVRPTPELSYAVRYLKTYAGIMITASHNTKEYNGYKIYGEDGAQLIPEYADKLVSMVKDVDYFEVETISYEALKESGLMSMIDKEVDDPYLDHLSQMTIRKEFVKEHAGDVSFVYTPLQGTGQMLMERTLARVGYTNVTYVPEQKEPDTEFSTLTFPNPEYASAFEYAIKYGKEKDADVLIATDPDADRMGIAVRLENGEYEVLTGNQIATLMVDYILQAKKEEGTLPENGRIVTSIVSSTLPSQIAKAYGVETTTVLTGFKFIAEKIAQYEETKESTYLFGFEESYGFLIDPFDRDKDAMQAAVLFAEIVSYYQANGSSVRERLQEIYDEYGFMTEYSISQAFEGESGAKKMDGMMSQLREAKIEKLNDLKVLAKEDYQEGLRTLADGTVEELQTEKSNVLKYLLEDGSWIAVRPSGTEPKIKFYYGIKAEDKPSADKKQKALEEALGNYQD